MDFHAWKIKNSILVYFIMYQLQTEYTYGNYVAESITCSASLEKNRTHSVRRHFRSVVRRETTTENGTPRHPLLTDVTRKHSNGSSGMKTSLVRSRSCRRALPFLDRAAGGPYAVRTNRGGKRSATVSFSSSRTRTPNADGPSRSWPGLSSRGGGKRKREERRLRDFPSGP